MSNKFEHQWMFHTYSTVSHPSYKYYLLAKEDSTLLLVGGTTFVITDHFRIGISVDLQKVH